MAFPEPRYELALHERVLAGDPLAPADFYRAMMDPLISALRLDLHGCTEDEVYDGAVDAVVAYLDAPEKYDPQRGRLSTFVMTIAKRRTVDRYRARSTSHERQEAYGACVEGNRPDPKEAMEANVEAHRVWEVIEDANSNQRDLDAIELIVLGESSTDALAEVFGLKGLPAAEQQRWVKRHRDRLMKFLQRLKARLGHGEGT